MAESAHILRKKMRFSSSSVRYTTSQNIMASKLRTQSNRSSVRFASSVSHIVTDLRHHHASSLTGKIENKNPRACSHVTVKNLCLRRVFSPSSISNDWDFHMKGENLTKELNLESPQMTPPESEMFTGEPSGSINQEISGVSGKKVGTNLGSKVIRHPEKIFKNPGSVSYRRMLPYLMEAADGTRDADAKDLKNQRGESMAAKNRLLETEPVWQSTNNFVKPSAQSLHGNISPSKTMTSSSDTKISLCSKRKLFKVPGSVNYRRMLSYLKENSDGNPVTPETSNRTEEIAPATETKGASSEARDLNTCSNDVEAPLSDLEERTGSSNFC
ncbi:unnamed protein product [Arabidopsis halleri]